MGRAEPAGIYEPFLERDPDELKIYFEALGYFEAGELEKAEREFRRLTHDSVAKAYLARISEVKSGNSKPSNWDAVWDLHEK